MPVWAKTRLFEPTPIIARLLLISLGVFTIWSGGYAPNQALIALAAAYAVWAVLLFAVPPFEQPLWLVCVAAALDVGATTTFAMLIGRGQFPTWALYVVPLAAAGAAGRVPAVIASSLTVAGYATLTILARWGSEPAALWPIGLLAATSVLVALLPSRWLIERREKRAREELAAERESARREHILVQTAAQLLATFEPDRVAQAVVDATSDGLMATAALLTRASGDDRDGKRAAGEPESSKATVVPVGDAHSLTVPPRTVPLQREDIAWLQRLGSLAEIALSRCTRHRDLEGEEQRLRAIWELLPAPAALWSSRGDLLLANSSYQELDLPQDVATGETDQELTIGEPARTFILACVGVADSGNRLTLLREITHERQELAAKDAFLSLVGHELRTPLTSIHGFSQMMDRNLSVIKQQVGQLDRLINDLATESSGKVGTLSLDLELVDLAELARGVAERFKGSYPDRSLDLEIEHVAPVQADPMRLVQVLDNLLNNAVKYSPADGSIGLRVGMRDGNVVLGVEDQGVGIAPEHVAHVFERFYRVPDARTEQVKGLGLGLSIVRDLIVAHGGRVWAESRGQRQGTTFWVSLPAAAVGSGNLGPDTAIGVG